ncbi:MAG: hypothetical protein ACE5R4_16295 [Armatimonadota bacterium]
MSESTVTVELYRTSDLSEAAALVVMGYALYGVEAEHGRATFVIAHAPEDARFADLVAAYAEDRLLVPPRDFARRRNELGYRMREALDGVGGRG